MSVRRGLPALLVAVWLALPVALAPAPVLAASTNTLTIVADTLSALPACLRWSFRGVCLYLRCSFWSGCRIVTRPRVSNYVPDLVVTARNESTTHPWTEVTAITAPTSATLGGILGMPFDAQAGGEGRGESSRDREHHLYRDADAIGHPLSAAGFLGLASRLTAGLICPPRTRPLFPYFLSELDGLAWRAIVPIESLYPAAIIPGLREIGAFPVNTWGNLYPRTGLVMQPEEPKAGAIVAQRVGDIVTRGGQPHVYTPITSGMASRGLRWWNPSPLVEGDASTGTWQMLEPRTDRSCNVFGINDTVSVASWGDGRKDVGGDYLFNLWRPYTCCRRRGIFLGTIP